ncbi:MAG: TRAP transporter substrate-binding protein [Elusimicrobiota bacterium]
MIISKLRVPQILTLSVALCATVFFRCRAASIKFATLAPDGSAWMKVMTDYNSELKEKTHGRVGFKMYPGGVEGDDKDVVKKMRIGEIGAAGLTGVGLGLISPQARVIDSPWLFRNTSELDSIHRKFDPEFFADFKKSGYILLGWTDLGFVYVFSREPILGPQDFKKQKMWVWEGDPIAEAAYQALGASPVPLSVIDVMSSLETGLINAVYGPAMGVVALQWFTKTKYIYSVPMAYSSGAVVVSRKVFDSLLPGDRKILLELGRKYFLKLNMETRRENDAAIKSLVEQGLKMSPPPSAADIVLYARLGREARKSLVGKLYSADLLGRIEASIARMRKKASRHGRR